MSDCPLHIQQSDIATVVALSEAIPEFEKPYGADEYQRRLDGVRHLILVAYWMQEPAGFKVGYERPDGFYSWMGGVLPQYRRKGIAEALADAQENWARQYGYSHIELKTRRKHQAMLAFALKRGFDVVTTFAHKNDAETRIILRKTL